MKQTLEHQPQSTTRATAENERTLDIDKKTALDLGAVATSADKTTASAGDIATGTASVDLSTGAPSTAASMTEAATMETTASDIEISETVEHTKYELLGDALIAYRRAWRGLDLEKGLQDPLYETHLTELRNRLAQSAADAAAQTLSQDDIKALQKKIDEFDDSEIEHSRLLTPHITKKETIGHDATPHKITLIGSVWDITDDPSLGAAIQVMNARMEESGA